MDIDMSRFGTDLKDADSAERVDYPELDRHLRSVPAGAVAVLDLSKVEFIGYAYARATVVACLKRVLAGRYPVGWLALRDLAGDRSVALEGLQQALMEQRLTMRLGGAPFGYLARELPYEGKRAQNKRQKMLAILGLLDGGSGLYTNEIATRLELTLPNCNYLLAELASQGLVERIKESSPSGGPIYLNRSAPPGWIPGG